MTPLAGDLVVPRTRRAADGLAKALQEALAVDPVRTQRVARLAQDVGFAVDGAEPIVLILSDGPPRVDRGGPADVSFSLSAAQAEQLGRGRLPLPVAVICGQVGASGAVRAYLEVDVILRSLLADRAGEDAPETRTTAPGRLSVPDPDVLAIETRGLHKAFGRQRVLAGADLQIPEGGISVVLGPSGTGKSVLLQHVVGLMQPDAGEVRIRGRDLAALTRGQLLDLRRGIGVMFQDGALFSALNVYDNVAFPLREHTNLTDVEIDEVVWARLAEVGLETAASRLPNQLSGGMRKRAGLARALALEPSIVLCDEPDSGLDPVRTALLADLLIEQHASLGGTMLVVTHNIALARRVADHITVLWQGRVRQSGMAVEVLESDDPFVRQFLAGASSGPLTME